MLYGFDLSVAFFEAPISVAPPVQLYLHLIDVIDDFLKLPVNIANSRLIQLRRHLWSLLILQLHQLISQLNNAPSISLCLLRELLHATYITRL